MALVELGAFYRLLESSDDRSFSLDVLGGGRYVYLKGELDINGAGPIGVDIEVEQSKDWVDAIVGGRVQMDLTEKLAFSLRGDVGGFGVGASSDLAWNLIAGLGYELSERTTLWLAYRHLDIDYDDGSGSNQFEYDVEMTGPMLGIAIEF
jgi:opacity protein-like surface antigen